MNGEELDMGSVIRDVLRDKDSVIVTTSLKRECARRGHPVWSNWRRPVQCCR